MFTVWLLLIRQKNDDLSCMTDVKKTDVWFRKMLLMTCLQQLETNCQTNRNSFCCRPAQGNGSSALENTEGRKISLTTCKQITSLT